MRWTVLAAVLTACGTVVMPCSESRAMLALPPVDEIAAASELAVVGTLIEAAAVDTGLYNIRTWSALLPVDFTIFGEAGKGDTLRFLWTWHESLERYPFQRHVGRPCIWFLRAREGGGFGATFLGGLVDLEHEYDVVTKLRQFDYAMDEPPVDWKALIVRAYLKGYLDGQRGESRPLTDVGWRSN